MKRKISTIIDALEKNGYEQIKGQYIKFDGDGKTVLGACALGQAALNLKVSPVRLNKALRYNSPRAIFTMPILIFSLNDSLSLSIPEIADELRRRFKDELDTVIDI